VSHEWTLGIMRWLNGYITVNMTRDEVWVRRVAPPHVVFMKHMYIVHVLIMMCSISRSSTCRNTPARSSSTKKNHSYERITYLVCSTCQSLSFSTHLAPAPLSHSTINEMPRCSPSPPKINYPRNKENDLPGGTYLSAIQ